MDAATITTIGGIVCMAFFGGLSVLLWTEVRAFREMNEALGGLLLELETAQTQMRAGIMAAILDRANADLPEKGSTAH
jgi:hypothetical protein